MSTARPSLVRLHVAIRRVVRDAQGIYSLGGFKPDLAKRYAEKLIRHLRRLRGISEVMIAANLGPKHADAVRWAKSICGEWHRVNESKLGAGSWEFVRQLLPMPDRLQEALRDELVAATVTTPPSTTAPPTGAQQDEGKMPGPQSAKQLLHGWRAIDEALGLSRSYSDMSYDERRRKLVYLNNHYGGPIKTGGKGRQPIVNRSELILWWNDLETLVEKQAEDQKARILSEKETLRNLRPYGRTARVAPDLGGSVKRRRKSRSQT
jgi:hypothetical protein